MGKKVAATAVSKISSASAPSASKSDNANKSSILRSAFAPSPLQLHLFASVIQSFESQVLRIHDTNTGRLRQQHACRSGTSITSLDWGFYSTSHTSRDSNKKKRKRVNNNPENAVIAYGTSASDICLYSPAEGRIVSTLTNGHDGGIKDFKFSQENDREAWSVGGDGKLVQWDLLEEKPIKSIPLPDSMINVLSTPSQYEPQILCASTSPFSIYPSDDFRIDTFDSFRGPVQSLQRSGKTTADSPEYFLAVDSDRFVNIFDIEHRKLVGNLVAGSQVESLDLYSSAVSGGLSDEQLLAIVTKDGTVELFFQPFKIPTAVNGDLKSKHKSRTKKADAQVKLISGNRKHANIFSASLQGPDLVVVSVDGGVDPVFQKIRWQDEGTGELLFEGTKEIAKVKSASTLNAAQMNGVKDMGKSQVDESKTVVVNGGGHLGPQEAVIEISSADEDEDEDESSEAELQVEQVVDAAKEDESIRDSDEEMEDEAALALVGEGEADEDIAMNDAEAHEPSFGELLASKHPNTIAIVDSFEPEKSTFDASKQLALPSGMSLGTVLTQALKTNDTNLLESCLHANDAGIIQNTIQRLDSVLAINLLSKLAERLASRPGRYGHLLSWVQWTCIAHGGAIAGQPDVAAKIRSLYNVLTQRSKSLDRLLLLKGKLDMLDAQLTLRKQLQAQRGGQRQDQGEPGMIYIEGEGDNWSSDDDLDEAVGATKRIKGSNKGRRALEDLIGDEATSEDDDEMPTMNGTAAESDEEESDEEAEVTGRTKGVYDLEADVSGEEDLSEEDEEADDAEDDSNEDDEEEEEEDSEMDSFINDGEIVYASDEDEIDLDDEPEVRKPEKKKSKHR